MAEAVTNELMYELLKRMNKRLDDLTEEMRRSRELQVAMLDRLAGTQRFEAYQEGINISLQRRVERIERRLDIVD